MAEERLKSDANFAKVIGGVTDDANEEVRQLKVDPTTDRLKVDSLTTIAPNTDFEGGVMAVGTTASAVTFTGTTKSIFLQSDQDNAGEVYIGKSNVTNAGANAMCRLSGGESITIEMDDSSNALYVVATQVDQKVYKFALLT